MKNNLIYKCLKELYHINQIEQSLSDELKIINDKFNDIKLRKDRIIKILEDVYYEELPFDEHYD